MSDPTPVLRPFHVRIYARGPTAKPSAKPASQVTLRGIELTTLSFDKEAAGVFARSFEEVVAALELLPRMFCEPDGSWVWVSSDAAFPWQLDGVLYDRGGHLLFVECKGSGTTAALDQLLSCLGWPETPLMFQLANEGHTLDDTQFREWAASSVA